jgi:hypothetical protein
MKTQLLRGEEMRTQRKTVSIRFKNNHSDRSNERTPDTVNVFQNGITPSVHYDTSLAVTTPCRVQLCAMLCGPYHSYNKPTI